MCIRGFFSFAPVFFTDLIMLLKLAVKFHRWQIGPVCNKWSQITYLHTCTFFPFLFLIFYVMVLPVLAYYVTKLLTERAESQRTKVPRSSMSLHTPLCSCTCFLFDEILCIQCVIQKNYCTLPWRIYRVIPSVLDPRKCEYLKDYSFDFEHAYMTTYLASWEACWY
jgi:hypothetical protein